MMSRRWRRYAIVPLCQRTEREKPLLQVAAHFALDGANDAALADGVVLFKRRPQLRQAARDKDRVERRLVRL